MRSLLGRAKPTHREVVELAMSETDPARAHRFAPIVRGPLFAIVAISAVLLLAAPFCLWRLLRGRSERAT
jgi:hypothetical protein